VVGRLLSEYTDHAATPSIDYTRSFAFGTHTVRFPVVFAAWELLAQDAQGCRKLNASLLITLESGVATRGPWTMG